MIHYILQTIAFQLFFLLVYDLFLKKETFFNWNRFYILTTAIASIALPFIKFESIRTIVPEQFVVRLPEVIIGDGQQAATISQIDMTTEAVTSSYVTWSWDYLLYAGMILASFILLFKIIKLSLLIYKNPKCWMGKIMIINLRNSTSAFSFFNYIFLGEWIKEKEKETILKHEQVHVSQMHSIDLLLFEMLRILFWFNPLIYMYQNRITTLHEYIADEHALKHSDKKHYYEKLLSQVFDTEQISFTNTFFTQSLIKKRILMLSKSKSNRTHLFKYALLIPMIFGMLVYTSSYAQNNSETETTVNQELTYEELADKYYKEIKEMVQNGAGMREIQLQYDMSNDPIVKQKYIKSMDELARIKSYTKYSAEEHIRSEKANGTFSNETMVMVNEALDRYKSYEDYLAYQKTDEARSNWENDTYDGVLRMVVDDMKKISDSEKQRQDNKLELIKKDDYFHSLLMTDGKTTTRLEVHKIDGKEIPGPKFEEQKELIVSGEIEVPFAIIDEVPTIEECKDLATNEEKRICFSNYISNFVNKNFNTKLGKQFGLKGKQRISVMFKIGEDGYINDVLARAPHPGLEAEAKRVINALPQMTPGRHKGKNVIVPYSLPILFQVSE